MELFLMGFAAGGFVMWCLWGFAWMDQFSDDELEDELKDLE